MADTGDSIFLGKTTEWDEGSAAILLSLQDASAQALRVQEDGAQSAYSIEIETNGGTTRFGILATAVTADMIDVLSVVTTANVLDLSAASLTTGKVIDISDLAAITTGKAIHVDATGVTQTDGILVHIDSASTALTATGRALLVDHTGNATVSGIIAEVASAAADETTVLRVTASAALALGVVLDLSAAAVTTGTVLDMGGLDALTTGKGINIVSNASGTGTRQLLFINNDNTAAVGTTCLEINNDATAGAHIKLTGTGVLGIDFTALGATDKLFDATAASGCTAAPQTNAAIGFLGIKVAGTDQWIPYYNAT